MKATPQLWGFLLPMKKGPGWGLSAFVEDALDQLRRLNPTVTVRRKPVSRILTKSQLGLVSMMSPNADSAGPCLLGTNATLMGEVEVALLVVVPEGKHEAKSRGRNVGSGGEFKAVLSPRMPTRLEKDGRNSPFSMPVKATLFHESHHRASGRFPIATRTGW